MNKKILIIALLIYKLILMNVALFMVVHYTSLGDNSRFVDLGFLSVIGRNPPVISITTVVTQIIIYWIKTLLFGSGYLTNLFFNLLAFCGIVLVLAKIKLEKNLSSYLFVIILFLPNFNLWSSLAGKEALVVFISGVVLRALADFFERQDSAFLNVATLRWDRALWGRLLILLAVALVLFYKPLFAAFILPLGLVLLLHANTRLSARGRAYCYGLSLVLFVIACYYLRGEIDHYSRMIHEAFPASARSNRPDLWTYPNAFFYTLPYTMWVAWWGPLPSELTSLVKLVTFVESVVLFAGYFGFVAIFVVDSVRYGWRLPIAIVLVGSIVLCVLTMPLMGTINPGSAVRYRTNNYLYLLMFFYYLARVPTLYASQKEAIDHRQLSA